MQTEMKPVNILMILISDNIFHLREIQKKICMLQNQNKNSLRMDFIYYYYYFFKNDTIIQMCDS